MPAAEGCSSVCEFETGGELPPFSFLPDDAAALFIEASSLVACGVSKSAIDFKQNFRAEGRLLASKCFWAMARHLTASSLLPSIVMSARISATAGAVQRGLG